MRTRDGAWIAAPSIPDTFVCNIGDCLMRWTNDVYCSTPHRVVSPAGRERYSVAFFLDADPDVVVEALPGLRCGGRDPALSSRDGGRLPERPLGRDLRTMSKITKTSEIQRAIADDIVRGRRVPGTALDETALAREFAVSRTPIREASGSSRCRVWSRPGRTAEPSSATCRPRTLDDMFAVMAELEALCARWSALAMTAAERRSLRVMHDASAELVRGKRREDYVEVNDVFHGTLYDGSHNAFLPRPPATSGFAWRRSGVSSSRGRTAWLAASSSMDASSWRSNGAMPPRPKPRCGLTSEWCATPSDDVTGAPMRRRRLREVRAS